MRPGYRREVHYVESSPADQLQPKHSMNVYTSPGDALPAARPVLFDVAARTQIELDDALFPNAYDQPRFQWRKDSHAVTFEYNQRGHQVYRVIEVDASTGKVRAVISEEPKTFFNYRTANGNLSDSGKKYRYDLDDGRQVIWMSERDGWNHLYMMTAPQARWIIRSRRATGSCAPSIRVDEDAKQIIFSAGGMNAGKDPYFLNYYRINFDGSGLTPLTTADGNHAVVFSETARSTSTPGRAWICRRCRSCTDRRRESADAAREGRHRGSAGAGWKPPEVFVAQGARRQDRHLGRHLSGRRTSRRRRSIR